MPVSHRIDNQRIVIGLIIIIFGALLIFFNPSFNSEKVGPVFDYNQTASTKIFEVNLSDFYIDTQGIPGFKPSPEGQLLVFNLKVKNKSNTELDLLPSIQTYVRDNEGAFYVMKPTKLDTPFESGKIPPNTEKSGQLSFEVPKRQVPLKFYFDPGWQDYAPVVFSLPSQESLNIKY